MPTFCRHSRLVSNCPICAREQDVELRPVVTPGGQPAPATRSASAGSATRPARSGVSSRPGSASRGSRVTVRQLAREADDGYHCRLVPGLRSAAGAERLATELAFAVARLERLATDPPGLYAEVADRAGDLEERTWLAFQIAYLGPLNDEAPFAGVAQARTTWASGELPGLDDVPLGPRTAHEPGRGARTIEAYRAWAGRAGSQATAFGGEAGWTPERRFARVFERLALPGLDRGARFDLLSTLGRLGLYELRAGALAFGGADTVTLGAKRLLGIGDPLLLERRAADLAQACGLPLEALDVGFYNWERGQRSFLGMGTDLEPDPGVQAAARRALGLD
jgi:alpha-glutamyl/putrescinyl thymine pyrophosphorylase-like protein